MNIVSGFGLDTITLNGSLESKLAAISAAGFTQVMINAKDLTGHPDGVDAAVEAVLASDLRITGFQVLRDFEGLSGHLHEYKVDIAKAMLKMCHALGSTVLLACSSTSRHATHDLDHIAKDLRKLAMLALPLGIKVAYEGLSWGHTVNEHTTAWEIVVRGDMPNLGIGIDSFHTIASKTALNTLDDIDPDLLFLVQLSDFMWQDAESFEERKNTARTFRVFPGEGVHSDELTDLVRKLQAVGYRGDYSFEVFNDDYQQLPLKTVCDRGFRSAQWVAQQVLNLPAPLPAFND